MDPGMPDRRSWSILLSHPAVRYPDVKCRRMEFRMWNVGARNSSPGGLSYAAQGGPSACARCRDPSLGWHGVRKAIRINSIRMIAYPIRICCPDHWLPPPSCSDALSGHLLLLAFRICLWQRTSKLRFFMFLSFPLLCHGFQRTLLNHELLWWSKSYQNTKT